MQNILKLEKIDLHGDEIVKLVSTYAPFLTPIAPATVAVFGMAHGLSASMGLWGIIPAVGSGLGMEGTGYMAAYLLMRAIKRGSGLSAVFAVAFLAAYAGFAIMAMGEIENAGIFQWFVCMSIACYLVVGQYTYENKQELERRQEHDQEQKDKDAELARKAQELALYERGQAIQQAQKETELRIEQERSKQERAKKAAVRAGVHPVRVRVRDDSDSNTRSLPAETIAKIRECLHGGMSVRATAEKCGVSVGSVDKYKEKVQP